MRLVTGTQAYFLFYKVHGYMVTVHPALCINGGLAITNSWGSSLIYELMVLLGLMIPTQYP